MSNNDDKDLIEKLKKAIEKENENDGKRPRIVKREQEDIQEIWKR